MTRSCPNSRLNHLVGGFVLALALLTGSCSSGERADQSGSAPSKAASVPLLHLVAEFSPQEALILGCAQMVQFHSQALVDIVRATYRDGRLMGLVGHEAEAGEVRALLAASSLPEDAIELVTLPVSTMWARDYGPVFVRTPQGKLVIVDALYHGTANNPYDDDVPRVLAQELNVEYREAPLTLEGGHLLGNGRGLGVCSAHAVARNVRERGLTVEDFTRVLQTNFGHGQWVFLKPLAGEPTGHVDMFCAFVEPDHVLVGSYDPAVDAVNAARLDENARALASVTVDGGPLRVTRIAMGRHDDGFWRTYTNVIFTDRSVLVPVYADVAPEVNEAALEVFRRALPEREVKAIDATTMIRKNGSLHCVSINVPRS